MHTHVCGYFAASLHMHLQCAWLREAALRHCSAIATWVQYCAQTKVSLNAQFPRIYVQTSGTLGAVFLDIPEPPMLHLPLVFLLHQPFTLCFEFKEDSEMSYTLSLNLSIIFLSPKTLVATLSKPRFSLSFYSFEVGDFLYYIFLLPCFRE